MSRGLTTILFLIGWFTGGWAQCNGTTPITLMVGEGINSFTSPNYPYNYPSNSNCQWLLEASSTNERIQLDSVAMDLEQSAFCHSDYITVYDGRTTQAEMRFFCRGNFSTMSSGQFMLVVFKSNDGTERSGFKLNYSAFYDGATTTPAYHWSSPGHGWNHHHTTSRPGHYRTTTSHHWPSPWSGWNHHHTTSRPGHYRTTTSHHWPSPGSGWNHPHTTSRPGHYRTTTSQHWPSPWSGWNHPHTTSRPEHYRTTTSHHWPSPWSGWNHPHTTSRPEHYRTTTSHHWPSPWSGWNHPHTTSRPEHYRTTTSHHWPSPWSGWNHHHTTKRPGHYRTTTSHHWPSPWRGWTSRPGHYRTTTSHYRPPSWQGWNYYNTTRSPYYRTGHWHHTTRPWYHMNRTTTPFYPHGLRTTSRRYWQTTTSPRSSNDSSRYCQAGKTKRYRLYANESLKNLRFPPSRFEHYPSNCNIKWRILAPQHHEIELYTESISMEYTPGCEKDVLRVYEGNASRPFRLLNETCSDHIHLTSTTNVVFVIFKSDSSVEYGGFDIRYTIHQPVPTNHTHSHGHGHDHGNDHNNHHHHHHHGHGHDHDHDHGHDHHELALRHGCRVGSTVHHIVRANSTWQMLESPAYPQHYPSNCTVQWLILAPPDKKIHLLAGHMELESTNECGHDNVTVYGGDSTRSPRLVVTCNHLFPMMTSPRNSLVVVFKSDSSVEICGFRLLFALQSAHLPETTEANPDTGEASGQKGGDGEHRRLLHHPDKPPGEDKWLNPSAMIGGVVGGVCILSIILPLLWWLCVKKKVQPFNYNVQFTQGSDAAAETQGGEDVRIVTILPTSAQDHQNAGHAPVPPANGRPPFLPQPYPGPDGRQMPEESRRMSSPPPYAQVDGQPEGGTEDKMASPTPLTDQVHGAYSSLPEGGELSLKEKPKEPIE